MSIVTRAGTLLTKGLELATVAIIAVVLLIMVVEVVRVLGPLL